MSFFKNNYTTAKNLHLAVSVIIIIPIAFVYGVYPNKILAKLLDYKMETVNLAIIFRALMGLYLAMCAIWVIGIIKPKFWVSATISNIFFMGGLSIGRLISLALDGLPENYFLIGLILEVTLALWGLKNLKRYGLNQVDKT